MNRPPSELFEILKIAEVQLRRMESFQATDNGTISRLAECFQLLADGFYGILNPNVPLFAHQNEYEQDWESETEQDPHEHKIKLSPEQFNDLSELRFKKTRTQKTCTVCQEDFKSNQKLKCLPCNHDFHRGCLMKWTVDCEAKCPNCKISLI